MTEIEQIIGDALLAIASNPHMSWHEKYLLCNRLATQCENAANAILDAEEARMAREDEETERLIYATGGF